MGNHYSLSVKVETKMRVLLFLTFLIYLATCKYHLVKTKGKAEGLTTNGHIWEGSNRKESGKDYTDSEDTKPSGGWSEGDKCINGQSWGLPCVKNCTCVHERIRCTPDQCAPCKYGDDTFIGHGEEMPCQDDKRNTCKCLDGYMSVIAIP